MNASARRPSCGAPGVVVALALVLVTGCELDNPAALTLTDTRESEPIRIDNHAPRVEQLRFASGRLTGRAVDGLGPIARLEVAVDGGEWRAVFPEDEARAWADYRSRSGQ